MLLWSTRELERGETITASVDAFSRGWVFLRLYFCIFISYICIYIRIRLCECDSLASCISILSANANFRIARFWERLPQYYISISSILKFLSSFFSRDSNLNRYVLRSRIARLKPRGRRVRSVRLSKVHCSKLCGWRLLSASLFALVERYVRNRTNLVLQGRIHVIPTTLLHRIEWKQTQIYWSIPKKRLIHINIALLRKFESINKSISLCQIRSNDIWDTIINYVIFCIGVFRMNTRMHILFLRKGKQTPFNFELRSKK